MTVDELKDELRARKERRNTGYGAHGERIYAAVMRQRGHEVQPMHKSGADFLVDGATRVDVKTTLMLDHGVAVPITPVPKTQMMPGVRYPRVVFFRDTVVVKWATETDGIEQTKELSWDEAVRILNDHASGSVTKYAPGDSDATEQRRMRDEVKARVRMNWGRKAKVVLRGNPKAQLSMGKWGPESFFHDAAANRGSIDLVILLYFDGTDIEKVFAYPMRCSHEIRWKAKPVGPNLSRRMTFDPALLEERFKFHSLEQFEREFCSRFP